MSSTSLKLGFIGLGIMGSPMAGHLIKAGHALFVHTHGKVPDEIAGHVRSYVDFLNEWNPYDAITERVIVNRRWRYMGKFDLLARFDNLPDWLAHGFEVRPGEPAHHRGDREGHRPGAHDGHSVGVQRTDRSLHHQGLVMVRVLGHGHNTMATLAGHTIPPWRTL